jgi:hypothetical protein
MLADLPIRGTQLLEEIRRARAGPDVQLIRFDRLGKQATPHEDRGQPLASVHLRVGGAVSQDAEAELCFVILAAKRRTRHRLLVSLSAVTWRYSPAGVASMTASSAPA